MGHETVRYFLFMHACVHLGSTAKVDGVFGTCDLKQERISEANWRLFQIAP